MTKSKFYTKLRKYANLFSWSLDEDGSLRGFKDLRVWCPITAVCYAENRVKYDTVKFEYAARRIGFKVEQIAEYSTIARCADEPEEILCGSDILTRRALLKAVKL